MRPTAETYARMFTMNWRAIRSLCRDVTEDEARRRPDGRQNPMAWLVGHIAAYRAEALDSLEAPAPDGAGLVALFGKDVRSDEASWPALPALVARLSALHDALVARLGAVGDEAFAKSVDAPAGGSVPRLLFLHFHETYHVGQLGYVRTWLGKPPLVPPGPPPGAR